jgi:transcriptional regulator with XRE-family HTH domain
MRKCTKKVIVTDESSTAEARSERVKRIRNIANLSQKTMCDDGTININTLKGWERGRYGGLPLDGAEKIAIRVLKEGVKCTSEWLLYGTGTPPQLLTDIENVQPIESADTIFLTPFNGEHEKIIINELSLFKKYYNDIVYMVINDDGMMPCYKINDYVAGVNRYGDKIKDLIGLDCIVKLENGEILLRKLREGSHENLYTIFCANPQTSVKEPILYNIKLLSAASVIRYLSKYF